MRIVIFAFGVLALLGLQDKRNEQEYVVLSIDSAQFKEAYFIRLERVCDDSVVCLLSSAEPFAEGINILDTVEVGRKYRLILTPLPESPFEDINVRRKDVEYFIDGCPLKVASNIRGLWVTESE